MSQTRFIVAGSFIDGSGAHARRNLFLAVQDSIITTMGSASDLTGNDGAAVDDFSHCTIVPALVDCSVSLSRSPSVDSRVRISSEETTSGEKAAMVERHIRYCHAHGVLGVAANNALPGMIEPYKQKNIIDVRTSGSDFLRIDYSGTIEYGEA
jgi:hypothetical protein